MRPPITDAEGVLLLQIDYAEAAAALVREQLEVLEKRHCELVAVLAELQAEHQRQYFQVRRLGG